MVSFPIYRLSTKQKLKRRLRLITVIFAIDLTHDKTLVHKINLCIRNKTMTTSIAQYYIRELEDWKETLDFDMERIDEMHEWLEEVLRFNTVTGFAGKAEHHLNQLFLIKQILVNLRFKLSDFEKKIYNKDLPLPNEIITEEIKYYQQQLRTDMYEAEKAYMAVKYDCDTLLANTIPAQTSKSGNIFFQDNL